MSENSKVFIIWKDYNGDNFEEFGGIEAAELRLDRLKGYIEENEEDYGARIIAVIHGDKLKIEVIETAKKTRLVPDRG